MPLKMLPGKKKDALRPEEENGAPQHSALPSEAEQPVHCEKAETIYQNIFRVFNKYMDLPEAEIGIITLWAMGAKVLHKALPSFPYLFFNATKGSGKSRILRLLAFLTDGRYVVSPSETVLFRTTDPLFIDEFESVANKEKNNLRELLNSAYKQGAAVPRAVRREKREGGEKVTTYEIEDLAVYKPICMANIYGMEDVLSDRCISVVLERSNSKKTKLLENWNIEKNVLDVKNQLTILKNSVGEDLAVYTKKTKLLENCNIAKNVLDVKNQLTILKNSVGCAVGVGEWSDCDSGQVETEHYNKIVSDKIVSDVQGVENTPTLPSSSTHTTLHTLPTLNGLKTLLLLWNEYIENKEIAFPDNDLVEKIGIKLNRYTIKSIFDKIQESGIFGRELELCIPLLIMSLYISEDIFDKSLTQLKKVIESRYAEQVLESLDCMLLDFISKNKYGSEIPGQAMLPDYIPVSMITNDFAEFMDGRPEWLTTFWIGRALKRLNLIVSKRRIARGIEVVLNVPKAKLQLEKFRMLEKETEGSIK